MGIAQLRLGKSKFLKNHLILLKFFLYSGTSSEPYVWGFVLIFRDRLAVYLYMGLCSYIPHLVGYLCLWVCAYPSLSWDSFRAVVDLCSYPGTYVCEFVHRTRSFRTVVDLCLYPGTRSVWLWICAHILRLVSYGRGFVLISWDLFRMAVDLCSYPVTCSVYR